MNINDSFTFTMCDTCLGWVGIVGSPDGLKRIILSQKSKKVVLEQIVTCGCSIENQNPALFNDLPDRLERYFKGECVTFNDKKDLAGTTRFQQNVWRVVCDIPYGKTRSYGWVANRLGIPTAARAVGQALARNPLPIIIPCHRVIGGDGNLVGFGGGVKIKKFLLHLEQTAVD